MTNIEIPSIFPNFRNHCPITTVRCAKEDNGK